MPNEEPKSNGASDDHRPRRRRSLSATWPEGGIIILVGIVVVVTVVAYRRLDDERLQDVWAATVRLAWQAVAIVLLGTLLSLALTRNRERRDEEAKHLERQQRFIADLIEAGHRVEVAGLIIEANRSVKAWSDMVTDEIIPAYLSLRRIRHDLESFRATATPLFAGSDAMTGAINEMAGILWSVIDELSRNKKDLSELQRQAEANHLSDEDRSTRQDEIWNRLQDLEQLTAIRMGGSGFACYRRQHMALLKEMRAQLGTVPAPERESEPR